MEVKHCNKCNRDLPIDSFYKRGENGHASMCIECDHKKGQKYYKENKEKVDAKNKKWFQAHPEKPREYTAKWRLKPGSIEHIKEYDAMRRRDNPTRMWARDSINGHKRKGHKIEVTIDELEDFIKDHKYCMVCGVEMILGTGRNNSTLLSPTIDRINNENLISLDSIQIICKRCNMTKSDRSMKEFVDYCRMVADKYEGVAV